MHPFLQWLDPLPYTLLPGGDFESGAAGWKLTGGARVVDGNEPFYVTKRSDSHSLLLPQGSSATSPTMCMGLVLPIVRYFSSGGAALSSLRVEAVYTDTSGRQRSLDLLPGGLPTRSWSPSLPALQLLGAVNALTLNGLTSEIALRFTPRGLLSAAARGGSTTSTSIPGRWSSSQLRASTCSRAAPVPTSSTVTSSSRSTSST